MGTKDCHITRAILVPLIQHSLKGKINSSFLNKNGGIMKNSRNIIALIIILLASQPLGAMNNNNSFSDINDFDGNNEYYAFALDLDLQLLADADCDISGPELQIIDPFDECKSEFTPFSESIHNEEEQELNHDAHDSTPPCESNTPTFDAMNNNNCQNIKTDYAILLPEVFPNQERAINQTNKRARDWVFSGDEKKFKCPFNGCNRVFNHKSNLPDHIRTHTGEKPFKCTQCDYASAREHDLKRHMTTHTGEKRFKCTKCNYASNRKNYLIKHMQNKHCQAQ